MIYLDNAATSYPKPAAVNSAVYRTMVHLGANPGRGGHRMAREASEILYTCRERLAELFHCSAAENIVFTNNTTAGLNMALKGILKPGDELIISSMEHNSVYRPAIKLQEQGVVVHIAPCTKDGYLQPEEVEKLICDKTKLICIIHASNVCGSIIDIEAIGALARRHGICFMVDAAQSAGCVSIDVEKMKIDVLAFPGHKGLLGPQGTGGLYVADTVEMDTLMEGGTGSESESPKQPVFLPDRYESGTLNMPGLAGLSEGVGFLLKKGIDAVCKYEQYLTQIFLEDASVIEGVRVLGAMEASHRTGAISIVTKNIDCVTVAQELDRRYGIAVRAGLHCSPLAHQTLGSFESGAVRFGIGVFNTKHEIKSALYALNKICNVK